MRKSSILLFTAAWGLMAASIAQAAEMYPWRQHQRPFNFVFGNEIDSHQQTRLGRDSDLKGFLYVHYTGVVTSDNYRVATHVNCNVVADCTVGWKIDGKRAKAKLVRLPMHDHPVFWMPRPDIPQPGSFAHFHWTGMAKPMPYQDADGYVLELTAVDRFCFIHHGAEGAMNAASCRANRGIPVERGTDIATHLNIVTNAPDGN